MQEKTDDTQSVSIGCGINWNGAQTKLHPIGFRPKRAAISSQLD